ncbi:hypothetical protein J416_03181 [Gracilibacillus halophilus YIM-C55.5]|uniref:Uncharacterized protein n=1 Tax=Gracilibacillus halophilus YIM-C55.5 TaxID=1308866 RepID=N4WXX7_9BACI|nr:hypothetical protein [Gracilibacillus halophilus]ENH97921.1 hypothetical protein J416_03181 [Gracilibacillus halophilus YIM-C55.5]
MNNKEKKWGLFLLIIVLSAYIIPYTLLSDVTKWYGSYFLWCVFGLIAIIANFFLTKDWGDEE